MVQFAEIPEGTKFHFNNYCWTKYSSFQAICDVLLGVYQFQQSDYVVPA